MANYVLASRLAARGRNVTIVAHEVDRTLEEHRNLTARIVPMPLQSFYLGERALELARQLASGPTRGYVRTREAIEANLERSFEAALDVERDYQRELGRSSDYREGVTAFIDKRAPRFTGQ